MGCDIHMWVERRESEGAPWVLAAPEWQCSWCSGSGLELQGLQACFWCEGAKTERQFAVRNYNLFAMLAGMRNGIDKTGDGYEPIAEPRGMPDDLSVELLEHMQRCLHQDYCARRGEPRSHAIAWPGEHSGSWLRLDEVLDYFERPHPAAQHQGWIALEQLQAYLDAGRGRPMNWCSGVDGYAVRKVPLSQARQLLACKSVDDRSSYYTLVTWTCTYRDDAGSTFIEHFLPACRGLAARPSDVRLVFNFDS
jgi:hypothetical protein